MKLATERFEAARRHVGRLLPGLGVRGTARALGISTESVARLQGGLGVRQGTVELVLTHERENAPPLAVCAAAPGSSAASSAA